MHLSKKSAFGVCFGEFGDIYRQNIGANSLLFLGVLKIVKPLTAQPSELPCHARPATAEMLLM